MRRPTISDVARAAGVSKTTVSHALNGAGRVNLETRAAIQEAANRIGYQPNVVAKALRTGNSKLIAVINAMPAEITSDYGRLAYYLAVANSAAQEALKRSYAAILVPPRSQVDWVRHVGIEGAIVMDPQADDRILRVLADLGLPVVTLGRDPGHEADSWYVDADMAAAATMVLDHFAELRECRPALVLAEERRSYSLDTLAGYQKWVSARGLPSIIFTAPEIGAETAGQEAVARLLHAHPGVNAIYSPLEAFATGALTAISEAGFAVPEDIQLATLDGVQARISRPALTAIDAMPMQAARRAVELLFLQIANRTALPQRELLAPKLIVRQSTGRSCQSDGY